MVTSAAIFGALHLINVIGGPPPFAVLVQVVFATLLGIAFGALLLRTNALWLLVGVHALFNTGSALQREHHGTTGFEAHSDLVHDPAGRLRPLSPAANQAERPDRHRQGRRVSLLASAYE